MDAALAATGAAYTAWLESIAAAPAARKPVRIRDLIATVPVLLRLAENLSRTDVTLDSRMSCEESDLTKIKFL